MIVTFIRTLILYFIVIFGIRIMGKRQLGELQPSELVITILISNIATLPIENTSVPLLAGTVPILTLMCFEVILSYCTMKSPRLHTLISGSPRIIIQNGTIRQKELVNLRYSADDLMEQLRISGVFDLQEVDLAIVETTGDLSIYKKADAQPAVKKDVQPQPTPVPPPVPVILDGRISEAGLQYCHISADYLHQRIKKEGYAPSDIFLMTCTQDKTVLIVPKIMDPKG